MTGKARNLKPQTILNALFLKCLISDRKMKLLAIFLLVLLAGVALAAPEADPSPDAIPSPDADPFFFGGFGGGYRRGWGREGGGYGRRGWGWGR